MVWQAKKGQAERVVEVTQLVQDCLQLSEHVTLLVKDIKTSLSTAAQTPGSTAWLKIFNAINIEQYLLDS